MESVAKLYSTHQPLQLSFNHHRPSFSRPILSLRTIRSPLRSLSIRASASSSLPQNPKPSASTAASPLLSTACTAVAAAALFLAGFHRCGAAVAAPVAPPPPAAEHETADVESAETDFEEREVIAEENPSGESSDVEALRSQMEANIKANKLGEAVEVLDQLIALEPEDFEWPLLKANIHSYMGETELAKQEFEEILKKDPLRVEAYHGLVMAIAQADEDDEDEDKIKDILKRIEAAMKRCEKEKNKSEVRDFKLLIAQIRVMGSDYNNALKLYQELVKDEPRDFRPYLCQGIIYSLLKKKNEAQKQFETFRRLVPKNHPYREYFEDNMFATKLFSSIDRESAPSRS